MANIDQKFESKIGLTSRYYEPLTRLKGAVSSGNAFDTSLSMPYYRANYKTNIDPIKVSEKILYNIKYYLDINLFNADERKLLLSELKPNIESFGADVINSLSNRIKQGENQEEYKETIEEYKKTIAALQEIRSILNKDFLQLNDMMEKNESEVFISYSHDNDSHRDWVLQLATRLRHNGVNVILDRWNTRLGDDLASFMERRLSKSARVICVCSDKYVSKANNGKGGAGYEKRIMTAELIKDQNTNWVIPLIFNNPLNQKTPVFLNGLKYISFENISLYESNYEELLRDLLDVPVLPIPPLGKNPFQNIKEFGQQKFIPTNEKYLSPATSGTVTFDYSNNNGNYGIGQNELLFETMWTKLRKGSIYTYNENTSINTIALAKDVTNISDIKDARTYDTSSRARIAYVGQIVILQNNNGFYAALKIIDVKSDEDGKGKDEITFEYRIQTNGTPDFTPLKP